MAIAATGITNTVIMAAYERIAEVGVLRALGMQKSDIRNMFLIEGSIMGLLAGLVGAILGGSANYYLSVEGIDLTEHAKNVGELPFPTMIYSAFSIPQILLFVFIGASIALLASLWPAFHAVKINPAEAVRKE